MRTRTVQPPSDARRLGAFAIDASLFWVATLPLQLVAMWAVGVTAVASGATFTGVQEAVGVVPLMTCLAVFPVRGWVESGRSRATPGKWLFGLQVAPQRPVRRGRYLLRSCLAALNLVGGLPQLARHLRADRTAVGDALVGLHVTVAGVGQPRSLVLWWRTHRGVLANSAVPSQR